MPWSSCSSWGAEHNPSNGSVFFSWYSFLWFERETNRTTKIHFGFKHTLTQMLFTQETTNGSRGRIGSQGWFTYIGFKQFNQDTTTRRVRKPWFSPTGSSHLKPKAKVFLDKYFVTICFVFTNKKHQNRRKRTQKHMALCFFKCFSFVLAQASKGWTSGSSTSWPRVPTKKNPLAGVRNLPTCFSLVSLNNKKLKGKGKGGHCPVVLQFSLHSWLDLVLSSGNETPWASAEKVIKFISIWAYEKAIPSLVSLTQWENRPDF